MLKEKCARRGAGGRCLQDRDVFDGLAITRFMTDIGSDETGRRESTSNGEGGKEPGRLGQEIVVRHGVGDAIWAGPHSGGSGFSEIGNFAALARGEVEISAASTGGYSFENTRAGFVVGTGDAAGGS